MTDRDELIEVVCHQLDCLPHEVAAQGMVDGGIDLGDGRRIAIIEELTMGYQAHLGEVWETCRTADGVEYDGIRYRIVTPDGPYEPTDEDELLENGFDIDAALGAVDPDPGES